MVYGVDKRAMRVSFDFFANCWRMYIVVAQKSNVRFLQKILYLLGLALFVGSIFLSSFASFCFFSAFFQFA